MKNIHVLPTDKLSRLHLGDNGNFVFGMVRTSIESRNNAFTNKHIYIVSQEEIKDEDWFLTDDKRVEKCASDWRAREWHKKIIITSDQDLIKDGVQAIDDEFLEWFVKNPSCEYIKTEKWLDDECGVLYSRTIPKEEPKQEILEDISLKYHQTAYENLIKELTKQETLKEVAKEYSENEIKDRGTDDDKLICSIDFIAGAKWQQEQDKNKYSEEEAFNLLEQAMLDSFLILNKKDLVKWFERNKKK